MPSFHVQLPLESPFVLPRPSHRLPRRVLRIRQPHVSLNEDELSVVGDEQHTEQTSSVPARVRWVRGGEDERRNSGCEGERELEGGSRWLGYAERARSIDGGIAREFSLERSKEGEEEDKETTQRTSSSPPARPTTSPPPTPSPSSPSPAILPVQSYSSRPSPKDLT